MSTTVLLNDRFVSSEEQISVFDTGLQHGIGLFETMLGGAAPDGDQAQAWVFGLEEHIDRLVQSAAELRLSDALNRQSLAEAVLRTVQAAGHARARVRLTVTAGASRPGSPALEGDHEPTVLVVAQPATLYPEEMFERGVAVAIADARANPLQPDEGHKTLNYWWRLRELQKAAARRAAESLVFQVTNHLCGGCVSNAFLVKDGKLLTPIARGEEGQGASPASRRAALPSPVLPGTTRDVLLKLAQARGLSCVTRMLAIDDVLTADEVFLTNSSWGVLPVVKVEAEAIGDAVVGEVSRQLRSDWLEAVGALHA